MTRKSALVLTLLLAACPGGGGATTATSDDASSGGGSTGSTTGGATTQEPPTTTATPTTSGTPTTTSTTGEPATDTGVATDPLTTGSTGPATSTDGSTGDGSTTDGSSSSTSEGSSTGDPVMAVCGDDKIEGDEPCDDGNLETELSKSNAPPLQYGAAECIDDCSLTLSKCGDGVVDPGEECDDGNTDSMDACTTSCLTNTKATHMPCKRVCQNGCDTDIGAGTIMGCDNLVVPNGAEKICFDSSKSIVAQRYFAEGECAAAAQSCTGGALCPPNVGDTNALNSCPNGTTLVTNVTMALNLKVTTKVCHKTCERDADCRWNAYDSVWAKPGQYRCQTTPDSGGVKICADAQNN
jgi:cysteine-rich repeat protein